MKNGAKIEIFEHPNPKKREFAPFKARIENGDDIGSIRRVSGNQLYLLLNRNVVSFEGTPEKKYQFWENLIEAVPQIPVTEVVMLGQKESAVIGDRDRVPSRGKKDRRNVNPKKKEKLEACKKIILDHMMSVKGQARSMRISKLRNVLSKKQFNPRHFGMEKFTDLLKLIPEIEFINQQKIRLSSESVGSKRKRKSTTAEDAKKESIQKENELAEAGIEAKHQESRKAQKQAEGAKDKTEENRNAKKQKVET